ncbi:MAG: Sua5/YciO/YrdC/YwlC family protein [Chitinophagaceae bacterium]|nr:Sua5/YciO/YrdC/YwlC family protein [Chitinophagaceae bacterium]
MKDFTTDLERCLEVLHAGGTILYPTDTVWGLGCDATNDNAVKKLIRLKGKPGQKGLIVLLSTERDVLQYVAGPDMELFNFLQQQTRPTTVIYNDGLNVADEVLDSDGNIAIRIAHEDFCRHLIKRFRKPIVATSANFHGEPTPQNFSQVNPQLVQQVDYTVKFRQQDVGIASASAIIKWNGKGNVTVLRK